VLYTNKNRCVCGSLTPTSLGLYPEKGGCGVQRSLSDVRDLFGKGPLVLLGLLGMDQWDAAPGGQC